jgi:hypothetical protein
VVGRVAGEVAGRREAMARNVKATRVWRDVPGCDCSRHLYPQHAVLITVNCDYNNTGFDKGLLRG